jgi:hypothetical protein
VPLPASTTTRIGRASLPTFSTTKSWYSPRIDLLLVRALGSAELPRLHPAAQILDLVAVHRLAAQAELEAVVVGRVVAAR